MLWLTIGALPSVIAIAAEGRASGSRRPAGERTVTGGLPGAFAIEKAALRGAPGAAIRGEVDVAAVPSLAEALDEMIRDSVGAFVIDLCDVEFLDSSGLSALMRARALLGREERALAVVCPPGPVRRLFEMTGVADLLFLYESRHEAAAALVPTD